MIAPVKIQVTSSEPVVKLLQSRRVDLINFAYITGTEMSSCPDCTHGPTVPPSVMSGVNTCETNAAFSVRVEVICAGDSGPMQHGKLLTEFVGRQPVSWFVCQATKQQQCAGAKFGFF